MERANSFRGRLVLLLLGVVRREPVDRGGILLFVCLWQLIGVGS